MSATNDKMVREYLRELYTTISEVDYGEMEKITRATAEANTSLRNFEYNKTIDDLKELHGKLSDAFPDDPEIVKESMIQFIKQGANFNIQGTVNSAIAQLIYQRIGQKYAQYVPKEE